MTPTIGPQNLSLRHKILLAADPSAPLVLLVHGRAGNLDVMWTFRRSIPATWSIVSVEAPLPDPLGGSSWWLIESEHATSGAPRAAQHLQDFLAEFVAAYNLAPEFIAALGFSQGAGSLSYLVQLAPALLRGAGFLAGFVVPADLPAAGSAEPRTKIFMAHGSKDEIIPLARAEEGCRLLQERGFTVEFLVDEVGHKIGAASVRALQGWLAGLAE